jgi:tetratricopeptide (TPR) repeat protein
MEKSLKLSLSTIIIVFLPMFLYSQSMVKDKQYYLEKAKKSYPQTSLEFRACLDSAIKIYPEDAQLWREVATSYFKSGLYAPAMKYINKAVELDPQAWLSYRAFMKCIFLKDYQQAITDFKAALALKNQMYEMDHTFYFYTSISYLKLNRLDSANYYMNLSAKEQLSNGKSSAHYVDLFYWGLIKHKQKNYAQALMYYNNALAQYSSFPDALYYKAVILLQQKKKKEALALLKLAEQKLQSGYRLNEDNEIYVNYPYQIALPEVQELIAQNQ